MIGRFVKPRKPWSLLALIALMANGEISYAQDFLFPEREWGKARMALPQSASKQESLFQVKDENFEPIAAFAAQSPFRRAATPVGRLEIKARDRYGQIGVVVCTASLISDGRALTNYHCIPGTEGMGLMEAQLRMGFLSDQSQTGDTYPVSLVPIEANAALDYSIIEVRNRPAAKYGTISLGAQSTAPGDDLFIIHHPLGKPLQLTRKDCRAVSWKVENPSDIGHRCHTLVGSSGAPIFSLMTWKVVGVHFQGGLDAAPDSYNSAKRLDRIIMRSSVLKTLARGDSEPSPASDEPLARCDMQNNNLRSLCLKARSGDREAQNLTGNAFYLGQGVQKDYETAVYWYKQAALQDQRNAQATLGYLYEKGYGVPMDRDKSVYWTSKAAAAGDVVAQVNLGENYELGMGVPIDLALAGLWYRRAAEQGDTDAKERLAYLRGTEEQFFDRGNEYFDKGADWYNIAVYWYEKAARRGHAGAMTNLGYMYDSGLGLKKDQAEAARWYREAAEANDEVAQYNLGALYESGLGVRQNLDKAREWYERSARQNYADARKALERLSR